MLNIFRIFIGDLKKISRNAIAWIVVLGLTVVPSLYAWFNIAASWDPYSNTDQLKVAVASVDKGYDGDIIPISLNHQLFVKILSLIGYLLIKKMQLTV